jgi:hypothetical protein
MVCNSVVGYVLMSFIFQNISLGCHFHYKKWKMSASMSQVNKIGGWSPSCCVSPGSASLSWQNEQGHCHVKQTKRIPHKTVASLSKSTSIGFSALVNRIQVSLLFPSSTNSRWIITYLYKTIISTVLILPVNCGPQCWFCSPFNAVTFCFRITQKFCLNEVFTYCDYAPFAHQWDYVGGGGLHADLLPSTIFMTNLTNFLLVTGQFIFHQS